jgi:hypothetical protein
MKNKILHLGLIVSLIVGTAGFAYSYSGNSNVVVENAENVNVQGLTSSLGNEGMLGGSTSDDWNVGGDLTVTGTSAFTGDVTFTGEVLGGVGVDTQSSTTNEVLTASQICDYSYLAYTPINALNLTLPATSTITSCLQTAGISKSFLIENAATTTNAITIVAGKGMDLQEPDGQNVVIGQNNYAWLTFVKQASGDVVVRVDETISAD